MRLCIPTESNSVCKQRTGWGRRRCAEVQQRLVTNSQPPPAVGVPRATSFPGPRADYGSAEADVKTSNIPFPFQLVERGCREQFLK
eukprot:6456245-Amphidinium_carterae.1